MLVAKGIVGDWQEGLTTAGTISLSGYEPTPTDIVWLHFKNISTSIELAYAPGAAGYFTYGDTEKFAGPFAANAVPVHVISGTADVMVVIGQKAMG
jgi:hypothetical protein